MDQIKKSEVISVAQRLQFMKWRLKTAGVYTTTAVLLIFSGLLTGNFVEDKRTPNVVAASTVVMPETVSLEINTDIGQVLENEVLAATVTKKVIFTRELMLGDVHQEVKLLQEFLNTHGFTLVLTESGAPSRETTYFGPWTEKALRAYQRSNNLVASGVLDNATRNYIELNEYEYVF